MMITIVRKLGALLVAALSLAVIPAVQATTICTVPPAAATPAIAEVGPESVHIINEQASGVYITVIAPIRGKLDVVADLKDFTPAGHGPIVAGYMFASNTPNRSFEYAKAGNGKSIDIIAGDGVAAEPNTGGYINGRLVNATRHVQKPIVKTRANCHEAALSPTGADLSYRLIQARHDAATGVQNCLQYPPEDVRQRFAALDADKTLTAEQKADRLIPVVCTHDVAGFDEANAKLAPFSLSVEGSMRATVRNALLQQFQESAPTARQR